MDETEIIFNVSEKTKQAFELALFISGKDKNEVFEFFAKDFAVRVLQEYRAELCEPPIETDFIDNGNDLNHYQSKAISKIPVWATRRKGQIGAQIVKAFFLCENNGVANRNTMREAFLINNPDKTAWSFDNNFASMCTEKGNSHGLFFVLSGTQIRPAESIKETLYQYRNEFLK